MADETISTRIVANADFSSLIADVHKVTASLSKLQEQLANSNKMLANNVSVINRNFSDTLRSTGQFSTHFVSLASDVEKFGKNLDGGKLKLNQYFNTFRDHTKTSGGLIRDLAKQQVAMQNAVLQPLGRNAQGLMQFNVHVPRGLDAIKSKTAIARQELQIMNKVIQDGAGQLINWGKNTQWAGRQLTVGLTVPLAAFGSAAAKAFREADAELVRLTKVYGDVAGTSQEELGRVRKEVIATSKELSAAYGTNFKETIGLAADIAATGKQGQELLDSVKETSRLAVLGEVDRQEAMKATLAIQSAFKQNTTELAESINFLNAVENQTSTTLNDLVEAIPKAGPVIKGLGGSVQDLALYLTAMREGGINASEGANALKSALASLINPTDKAVEKFQGFGIDLLGIVNSNAGNVTETLMQLQGALDRLDPLQKQQAIEQLFGKFQFSRLNALFENLGRQGSQTLQVLDLMKASASELESVAARELTAVTESASGKYKRAIESLKADLAGLGDSFLSISTQIVNIVDKALEFFATLPKPIKQALTFIGGLTAVAGPLIMLTGVLANFFGYILKGIGHMKAFFRGGEGWKYLTPEMMAAEKAGKLVEQTFYSDAKAASILQLALKNLIDEFSILEAKSRSGAISVNPAVSTMAGNLVTRAGGPRVVNPNNPLAGQMGTRASTHMVARASLTEEQRMQQTIFGLVPGSIPLNQKIGEAPQIYMQDRLPNVPGLTSVGGASTGVVASEAARWHSMTATLAMQSKAEIEALKKQMVATGVLSKEFMGQFDDMLPIISKITDGAARESALIVAELRAGKLTVEAAKSKIIALNLEVERMIASAATSQATSLGRTLNPTMVPTLNQPVVDATGRSNMRELFKKSKTKDFIDKVSKALGVRTSGAGYNIETTIPRKMNTGGYVYGMADGDMVPGPNVNADIVPAMLTPGEFIVNADATRKNLPLLRAINGGPGTSGMNKNAGGGATLMGSNQDFTVPRLSGIKDAEMRQLFPDRFGGSRGSYRLRGTAGVYLNEVTDPTILSKWPNLLDKNGRLTKNRINALLATSGLPTEVFQAAMAASRHQHVGSTDQFLASLSRSGIINQADASGLQREIDALYTRGIKRLAVVKDSMNPYWEASNRVIQKHLYNNPEALGFWNKFSSEPAYAVSENLRSSGEPMRSPSMELKKLEFNGRTISIDPLKAKKSQGFFAHATTPNPLLKRLLNAGITSVQSRFVPRGWAARRNRGGMIGFNSGGMVPGYQRGGIISEAREKGFFGQGMMRPSAGGSISPMAGMGMGMGMQMAGSMIPGPAGTALQVASFLPMMMPGTFGKTLTIIPKLISGFTNVSKVLGTIRSALVLITRAIPGVAVIAGIYGIVKAFQAWRKEVEETKRENIMLAGITKKGAEEAKIKYVDLAESIKLANEQLKLNRDRGLAAYAAYTSSGVPGLTLTIKQLKELKKQVKESMPETLATFNSIDSSKVTDLAQNLKAQYVAGGMSVQDATNKIYALIEASDKAGMGLKAIADKGFVAIQDKATASESILKSFSNTLNKIYSVDPEAFASSLDSVLGSLDSAVTSLIGTKDASGQTITQSKAIAMQYEKIAKLGLQNKVIGQQAFSTLQKHRPELAAIVNSSDTIFGIYSKWKLALSGVAVDLKSITSEQANSLAMYQDALNAAASSAQSNTSGALGKSAAAVNKLKTEIGTAETASKAYASGESASSKARLKAINDEIKAIRKRADEKKKALQDSLNAESTELELQKLQIEHQQALARGDKDAAAQAQIQIQQVTKQYQTQKAIDRIEENAKREEEKQQKMADAIQAKDEKKAADASTAGNTISQKTDTMNKILEIQSKLAKLSVDQANVNNMKEGKAKTTAQQVVTGGKQTLFDELTKLPNIIQEAFSDYVDPTTDKIKKDITFKRSGLKVGGAEGSFNSLTKEVTDTGIINYEKMRQAIGGGATLKDIYDILAKGSGGIKRNLELDSKQMSDLTKLRGIDPSKMLKTSGEGKGDLTDILRQQIIRDYNLKTDDTFTYDKIKYRVTGSGLNIGASRVTSRAGGGRIVPGVPYALNDGGRVEGIKFDMPGTVFSNINTMPRYNIPTNSVMGSMGNSSSSTSNNNYTINIELNGTNVTADDIMKRMKSEMALISAKEGRTRTVGGI
jgi:TP901 family phage tail tape measure protein